MEREEEEPFDIGPSPNTNDDWWMFDESTFPHGRQIAEGHEWKWGTPFAGAKPQWYTSPTPAANIGTTTGNPPPQGPPTTTTTPTNNQPPPGGPGYTPAERRPLGALNYPQFNAPRFEAPGAFSYDPFSYESFQAPTLGEAQNEPGFEYALQQGIKAMENSKAYLGTYRSGSTIKGLNDYARNMSNQNYNDVYRRKGETYDRNRGNAFGNWSANRNNAADSYSMNYGISRDAFDRNYQGAKDEYAPRARGAELEFARDWDLYTYEGDDDYRRWKTRVDAAS